MIWRDIVFLSRELRDEKNIFNFDIPAIYTYIRKPLHFRHFRAYSVTNAGRSVRSTATKRYALAEQGKA
jgi:hypothetical protein